MSTASILRQINPVHAPEPTTWRSTLILSSNLCLGLLLPAFNGTQRFITVYTKAATSVTILIKINSYRAPKFHFLKIHFNIIFPNFIRLKYTKAFHFNLLAPELFFLILAHPVYKMWIIQEPNKLELWNKLHFWREKKGDYTPCLKYSVPIFVE